MANTTSQVETWSSFYNNNKEEIPTLQAAYEMSFENHDTMTQALNQLGDGLVLRTATLPHNFVLLPGSSAQGKVFLLHRCFTVSEPGERPILVGVNGNRYLSPFKAFDPDDATVSLKPPTVVARKPKVSTRSKPVAPHQPPDSKHFIPTLRQFLEVEDGNHFMGLAGDGSGQEVATLAEWPTSFLLHPEVFICLDGAKEIRALEAALVIIRAIIQAYNPTQAQRNGSDSSNSDNPAQAQRNRSNSSHSEDEESQEADNTKNGLKFSVMATVGGTCKFL
jgi:hypothetical protein